jgi:hypothetical protein
MSIALVPRNQADPRPIRSARFFYRADGVRCRCARGACRVSTENIEQDSVRPDLERHGDPPGEPAGECAPRDDASDLSSSARPNKQGIWPSLKIFCGQGPGAHQNSGKSSGIKLLRPLDNSFNGVNRPMPIGPMPLTTLMIQRHRKLGLTKPESV